MDDHRMLFILGAPRSGTSFLSRVLRAHPEVHTWPELRLTELAALSGAVALRGADADLGRVSPVELGLGRAFVRALVHRLRPPGVRWVGDKFPLYAQQIPLLEQLFPGSRYLHLVRDGRDVVSSRLHAYAELRGWRTQARPTTSVAFEARQWAGPVRAARAHAPALGERHLEIRYEALVADPAGVGARLLDFLGLAPDPRFDEVVRSARADRDWRVTLSPAELEQFRRTDAEPLLAELGYPPTPASAQEDVLADVLRRAEAARADGRHKAAANQYLRALRLAPGNAEAVAGLLAMPRARASTWGALVASDRLAVQPDPALARAVADWLPARGLDPALAALLMEAA